MSCASASPAPQRWYMMHWVAFVQWGVVGKGDIIYHQHHFVVVCKLPNQSYPLQTVVPISKNRRYRNFPTARELFYFLYCPDLFNTKGLDLILRDGGGITLVSLHPQSMYKKRSPPDILWVAYLYMGPTPQPSNLTHDSTHHRQCIGMLAHSEHEY